MFLKVFAFKKNEFKEIVKLSLYSKLEIYQLL